MKRTLSLLLCLVLAVGLLPLSAAAATEVKEIKLTLDYPEAGKTPPGTATWLTQGYSIYAIDWYDRTANRFLETGEKIQADHQYRATLWVMAMSGYEFTAQNDSTPGVKVYINREACTAYKAYEYKAWAMVCVDYDFQTVPSKGWIKSVSLNIPAPVTGEKPDYTRLSGTGYASGNVSFSGSSNENSKNGITWYSLNGANLQAVDPNTGVFASNTDYTVLCLVIPMEGYQITRDATATVNGDRAEARLDYDSFLAVEYRFPRTGEAFHTHFYTDWQYNSGQHYKNCTDCDDVFFVESHKGGAATCQTDGTCTVCGYAYLKATDHKWSPTWLYQDKSGHAWVCADCKTNSPLQPHTPGAEATESTPQTCKDCGYILVPAKNHAHNLTHVPAVPADCVNGGNIEYWFCVGCNDCFTDPDAKDKLPETSTVEVAPLGHETGDGWGMDEQFHWRSCTRCKAVPEETKMAHEGTPCTTCGYKEGQTVPTTEAPSQPAPEEAPEGSSWILVILLGLVCFGLAVTVAVIILKKKQGGKP